MTKNPWIGIILVIAVIAVVIAYSAGQNSGNAGQVTSVPAATTAQSPATGQEQASPQEQRQCATDGATWFQNWLPSLPAHSLYDGPEYHFNQKLNTCLVYVGEMQDTSPPIIDFSAPLPPSTSAHESYVYNVYANTPILQSWITRSCSGSPSVCTETPNQPFDNSVPNLSSNDFFAQKVVLMSQ